VTNSEPVLWSHYAAGHRGIALEVDQRLDPKLHQMQYTVERAVIDPRWIADRTKQADIGQAIKDTLLRKSPSWAYEKEQRVIVGLNRCIVSSGSYYTKVPDDFLKRVILGVRCAVSAAYIRRALDANGYGNVEIVQAQMNEKTFGIHV
jgi:hypothetical protein